MGCPILGMGVFEPPAGAKFKEATSVNSSFEGGFWTELLKLSTLCTLAEKVPPEPQTASGGTLIMTELKARVPPPVLDTKVSACVTFSAKVCIVGIAVGVNVVGAVVGVIVVGAIVVGVNVVGAIVGAIVGLMVVGANVGAIVVGLMVVGDMVGIAVVGLLVVGEIVGASVGAVVGVSVGAVVGDSVVGPRVGDAVGAVGVAVGDAVGASVLQTLMPLAS